MKKISFIVLVIFVALIGAGNRVANKTAGGGPPARIAHAGAGAGAGATDATTTGIDTTGANFIVIYIAFLSTGTTPVISDSYGNTWTPLTLAMAGASGRGRFYYSYSPTVGAGHTFSGIGATSSPSIVVEAWSGMSGSPFDLENSNLGTSATPANGSLTPSQANTVVFTAITFGSSRTLTAVNGSFTLGDTVVAVSGEQSGTGIAYRTLTAATAQAPSFTLTGSAAYVTAIASFKY